MASEKLERRRKVMSEDYRRETGSPFQHFFCPILMRDEPAALCLGHIVNQVIPNSFRGCVVQRKDVDGFFGQHFEGDFATLVQARNVGPGGMLFNADLRKKMRPKITIGGEECPYYEFRGHKGPNDSKVIVDVGSGKPLELVFQKTFDEMERLKSSSAWSIEIQQDLRVSAFVSLIKATYLTLFRLLGYRYALSSAGMAVGYSILGEFYRANAGEPTGEVRERAAEFFRPYIHMVRPIERFTGVQPRGTVEDRKARICFTSSGRKPFGLIVCVLASTEFFAVMMPAFDDVEGVAAYESFLKNDNQVLWTHRCIHEDKCVKVEEEPTQTYWPKNDQKLFPD
jgi:hypothetical protein